MPLSKDAIADVAEIVRGVDFYRPAHEVIHDAIIDLYGTEGSPPTRTPSPPSCNGAASLQRVGWVLYLHTLSANVPIAANAAYYGEIVREKAVLRRLPVYAGTRIVQIGYAGQGQVDDWVDQAQAEVYKVTDRRAAEDYAPLSDIMDGALNEIEAIGNREAGLYGVPTGFADLDDLTNGLHAGYTGDRRGEARHGQGARPLYTPAPVTGPGGRPWTSSLSVTTSVRRPGSTHPGRRGDQAMLHHPGIRCSSPTGSTIVADAEHQWLTTSPVVPATAPLRRSARPPRWPIRSPTSSTPSRRPDGLAVKVVSGDAGPVRSRRRSPKVHNPDHLYLAGHSC